LISNSNLFKQKLQNPFKFSSTTQNRFRPKSLMQPSWILFNFLSVFRIILPARLAHLGVCSLTWPTTHHLLPPTYQHYRRSFGHRRRIVRPAGQRRTT
jgi:hypothetical protein